MLPWSKRLFWMMVQRRWINVTFRMMRMPSRIIALILSVILILAIWSDILFSGKGENLVDFIKHDRKTHSQTHFRPVKRDVVLEESKHNEKPNDCPIFQFKSDFQKFPANKTKSVTCKRLLPVPGSCDTAKDIFDLHGPPVPVDCSYQERFDFCSLQKTESNAWVVLCDPSVSQICMSGLKLGLPSHETGDLIWETHQNANLLAETLTNLIQGRGSSNNPPHYGFAFITCNRIENFTNHHNESYYYYYEQQDTDEFSTEQLLLLPPFVKVQSKFESHAPKNFHDLNLNVILVDSVSHQHMFRSLPKTVSMLEQIAAGDKAHVFNFELFQAIKSRTFETLQTIFSGYVNVTEKPFGRYDIPSKPLDLVPIYKPLQDREYRTLWLEDLCYLWEWGISKDLRFLHLDSSSEDTWKRMWLVLEKNGVDNIDATISMCRVLKGNGVRDHFHGPDTVCFNGKHQHEYILEYLQLYQTEMAIKNQPFFTMTSTNVAHEQTGKRVQTLDNSLANYVSFSSSLKNTMSIIFSDHGNAYGKYFEKSKEAMVELYHPFMFFIIPSSAEALLGKDMMDSLRLNTKRLITPLDIHYTLLHIVDIDSKGRSKAPDQQFLVSEKGLFDPVDPQRDCFSVPRLKPNICICQTTNIQLTSTSFGSLFGYLALGTLNDEIQVQYIQSIDSSSPITAFGKCEPLYLEKVTDIKEIGGPDGQRFFQMNIHVQQSQIFFISVSLKRDKKGNPMTVLESYSRITPYGIYSNCCDKTVEPALCICNLSPTVDAKLNKSYEPDVIKRKNIPFMNENPFQRSTLMSVLSYFNYSVIRFKNTPCFYIFGAIHKDGEVLFGMNECESVYALKMNVRNPSKFIYFHNKEDSIVLPGGIALFGLVVSEYGEVWKDSVQTDFNLTKH